MIKKRISVFIAFLFLLFSNKIFAQSLSSKITLNTGVIHSEITEKLLYVHEGETNTISRLDWKINAAPCLNLDYELGFSNKYFIALNGLYTFPLSKGSMNDYDWLNLYSTGASYLTHYSNHKNNLDYLYNTELAAGAGINLTDKLQFIQYFSIKYSYLCFTAKDGYKQYGKDINNTGVYTPWSNDIEKIKLSGNVVSYETKDLFFGLGSKIIFNINSFLKTELFAGIYPSIWNETLDTHYRRSEKYVFFDFNSKLDFDASLLLEYNINKSGNISTKFCYSGNTSNNAAVYQSSNKKNWERILNPGQASETHWSFLLGYSYKYDY